MTSIEQFMLETAVLRTLGLYFVLPENKENCVNFGSVTGNRNRERMLKCAGSECVRWVVLQRLWRIYYIALLMAGLQWKCIAPARHLAPTSCVDYRVQLSSCLPQHQLIRHTSQRSATSWLHNWALNTLTYLRACLAYLYTWSSQ